MENEPVLNPPETVNAGRLRKAALLRLFLGVVFLGLMFFLPAGTLEYWQAWVYLAVMFIPVSCVMAYLLKKNPELLERRLRMKEKKTRQKGLVLVGYVVFALGFLLPGLDRRFGWSSVPPALVVAADALFLMGYALFVLVLRENSYASHVVEVEQKQKVITTGPYAAVRHPMYSALVLIYASSPLALGSYWALIPFGLMILILAVRLLDEEKVLLKELDGYREYMLKTRYRLIPGVW